MAAERDLSRRAFLKKGTVAATAAVPVSALAETPGLPPPAMQRSSDRYVDASGNPWQQVVPPPPADLLPVSAGVSCCKKSSPPPRTYKVPLAPEQEKRATALYDRALVITGHDHCFEPGDFSEMEAGGITVRNIELLTDGLFWWGNKMYALDTLEEGWEQRGKLVIAAVEKVASNSAGKIIIVRRVADIERAKREHKLAVILGWEGARALAGKVENVQMFCDLGLRVQELYWYVPSLLKNADGTPNAVGLEILREMDRLGIVIDLSHMLGPAFQESIATTRNPVVVSHCDVAAISHNKPSNTGTDSLGDDTIRAMANNGGVICLNIFQMRPRYGPRVTVRDVVDHVDYIKRLVGIDHAALTANYMPNQGDVAENSMRLLMPNIAREMVRREYTDEDIQKVLGLNLLRVYRTVWKG